MDGWLVWGIHMACHSVSGLSFLGEVAAGSLGVASVWYCRGKRHFVLTLAVSLNHLLEAHDRTLWGVFRVSGLGDMVLWRHEGYRA